MTGKAPRQRAGAFLMVIRIGARLTGRCLFSG
jgi:hypothetical protein